jgi:hypothetical protein
MLSIFVLKSQKKKKKKKKKNRATASIKMDLQDFRKLGEEWRSEALVNFADGLSDDTCDANAGRLYGNRMFYANDYMVWFAPAFDVFTTDKDPGSPWLRLRHHRQNVLHADKEFRMQELAKCEPLSLHPRLDGLIFSGSPLAFTSPILRHIRT